MKEPQPINVGIITLLVLLAIMLFSGFFLSPYFENPRITFIEEPLEKNTKLQIKPGETYVYSYLLNNSSVNITYATMRGSGCIKIFLAESANLSNVCIDEWGMDEGGSNVTFEDPAFILFQPWMLALHPTWEWNNSMYLQYNNVTQNISDNYYRVMRTEIYKGRNTYVVEIKGADNATAYQWVDAEKRVLVRVLGEGYEVELVTSPLQEE